MQNISNLHFLLFVIISIACGISFRFSLLYAKQLWSQTLHYSLAFALLPPITMIITTLIAGNIALSLGMIGALSIVRFRNPVKSPFELVIYFALITIGIGMAINYKYGLGLTVIINLVIIIFKFVENFFLQRKGKRIFPFSFEEGNRSNFLTIRSKKKIEIIENDKHLNDYHFNKMENIYIYELMFESRSEINTLKNQIEMLEEVQDVQVRYVN